MGSGMARGFEEVQRILPVKETYILDQDSSRHQSFNEGSSTDLTQSSLPPILPHQLRTPQYANPLPPITGLQVATSFTLPRRDLQRNSSSPVQMQRYAPYERPPSTQRSSPPQRAPFPRRDSDRSPKQEYQSAMRIRQEANPPPPFAPLNLYQQATSMPTVPPIPIEDRPMANLKGSRAMLLSSVLNEIPTKPVTELYSLRMRQQPVDGRMCGNGLQDRRHIDPPPVVQLFLNDPNMNLKDINKYLVTLHCLLFPADSDVEARLTPEGSRRLEGAHSVNPNIGPDEFNNIGCFFVFGDLSCRNKGRWRLKFKLTINLLDSKQGWEHPFMAECWSDVFLVSEPAGKDKFRGMSESTPLTRALKAMGCNVKLRRAHGSRAPKNHTGLIKGSDEDDGEGNAMVVDGDDEVRASSPGPSRGKRRRGRGGRS